VDVERIGLDLDEVARRSRPQHILGKGLAKARDVDAQRRRRILGRVLAPVLVDQTVSGNYLVRMEEEHGE
jgi:hypothetical protein